MLISKTKKRNYVFILFGIFFILILGGYFYIHNKNNKELAQYYKSREIKVVRKNLQKWLVLSGKVLPSSSVDVYSPVKGQLAEFFVKEGQKVLAGQKLFSINQDTEEEKNLTDVQAALDKALQEYLLVFKQWQQRQSVLDLFSQESNDKLKFELKSKENSLKSAKKQFSLLQNSLGLNDSKGSNRAPHGFLSQVIVKAPRHGVVTLINKFQGESVLSHLGSSLTNTAEDKSILTISDLDSMIVRTRVMEGDLASLKEGMESFVTLDAYSNLQYSGHVARISQQGIEDKSGGYTYFIMDVKLDKKDGFLKPKMNTTVKTLIDSKDNVLVLPNTAVASLGGHSVVEIQPPPGSPAKTPFYKPVKVGLVSDEGTEIMEESLALDQTVLQIDFSKLDLKALADGKLGAKSVKEYAQK